MNDFDLETKLRKVPVPERPEDYWEHFPSQVRRQLSQNTSQPRAHEIPPPQFAWKIGIGFACLMIGLIVLGQPLKSATCAIFKNERIIRQQLAQLPGHLRVFMADEHGLHYLIAEKE